MYNKPRYMTSEHAGKLLHRSANLMEQLPDISYSMISVYPDCQVIKVTANSDLKNVRDVDRILAYASGEPQLLEYSPVAASSDVQLYGKTIIQADGIELYALTKTTDPISADVPVSPEAMADMRTFSSFLEQSRLSLGSAAVNFYEGRLSVASIIAENITTDDTMRLNDLYESSVVLRRNEGEAGGQGTVLLSNGLTVSIMSNNQWFRFEDQL